MYIELQLFHLPDPHANLTQNVDTEFQLHFGVLVQKDARLLRDLRIMAYFKQCFSSDSNISTIKELAHALASHCPYEVPIASIKIRHLHCEVPSSEIFFSLNATIVGLAVDSEGPENLPSCLGLGIVRGIDIVKAMLYVITPVPHNSLEKVNLWNVMVKFDKCHLKNMVLDLRFFA
ncbi:hypothetical protein JHK85_052755 [Glycine max]|nr:hypothetical protein JHK85_052755 [Glycine max]